VPGATEIESPAAELQMADWILQYGADWVPDPGQGLVASTYRIAPRAGSAAASMLENANTSRRLGGRNRPVSIMISLSRRRGGRTSRHDLRIRLTHTVIDELSAD